MVLHLAVMRISVFAMRVGDILEIDVIQHEIPEDPAEIWVKNWINLL